MAHWSVNQTQSLVEEEQLSAQCPDDDAGPFVSLSLEQLSVWAHLCIK